MVIRIFLQHTDGTVTTATVEDPAIIDASILVYKGKHFVYGGRANDNAMSARFNEVNPPLTIE